MKATGLRGFTAPNSYWDDDEARWALAGTGIVDLRAGLLPADRFIDEQLDPYVAVRTAWLQRRLGLVYDGDPPRFDYDFEE